MVPKNTLEINKKPLYNPVVLPRDSTETGVREKELRMKKLFRLTKEGVAELETELAASIADRVNVAERIKTAREFGDLSENAEYQTAREEQERLE